MLSDLSYSPAGNQPAYRQPDAPLTEKLGRHKKKVLAFGILLLVGSVGLCALSRLSDGVWVFALQLAGFFALGYLHAVIQRANVMQLSFAQKIRYTAMLALLLLVAAAVCLYLFTASLPLAATAFVCAFVWPFTLTEAARLFEVVTDAPIGVWHYSPDLSLQKATTFLNSIPVRFRIKAGQSGDDGYVAAFRAPVRMKLGLLFYHTVQDQNSKGGPGIKLVSPNGEPYGWMFSVSGFGGPRYLNPDLSLFDNGVKENAIVTARRVKTDFLLPES